MKQHEYTATVFTYPNGRLAVHGNSIQGLVLEIDSIDEMRSELLRIVPILLRANHGLNDEEVACATLRLSFHDAPSEDADFIRHPSRSSQSQVPTLLWEDSPSIPTAVYA